MPDSKDVERRICELLDMDDEELAAEMERYFFLSNDRHQRICDTIGEMIQEVDRLISCLDDMQCRQPEDEEIEPISR